LALDESRFFQSLTKRSDDPREGFGRPNVKEADDRRCCLLRACRARPHGSAAKQHEELTSLHYSITSSARASSVGGNVMPRALAVLRLITSSILVGCSTGSSPGLAPLRIL